MKLKTAVISLVIVIFLASACSNLEDPALEVSANLSCTVRINEVAPIAPGETLFLAVDKTGFGWTYHWSTTSGILSDPDLNSTRFDAPTEEDTITIYVNVTDDQGCLATDSINVEVVSKSTPIATEPVALEPTATITAAAVLTHTPIPSPSPLPTLCPVPDVALLSDKMELSVGETVVFTLDLADNETVISWYVEGGTITSISLSDAEYTAPNEPGEYQLLATVDNECGEQVIVSQTVHVNPLLPIVQPVTPVPPPEIILAEMVPGSNALHLEWRWYRALASDEHLGIRLWRVDPLGVKESFTWVETSPVEVTINPEQFSEGEHYFNIAIMRESDTSEHGEMIVESEVVTVDVPAIFVTPSSDPEGPDTDR